MRRALIIFCWISIITGGIFLRFDELAKRPFHADEATGARITAARMESGDYKFDPFHYHGPILSGLAIPICKIHGEQGWREMTKFSLRLLPAIAGCLVMFVPLLWVKRYGLASMLLATALLATSPLLVYYSRMFIHEMLLVLFGMLALVCLFRFPRYGIPGLFIGLMFVTKESFAISMLAWMGAACGIAWENRKSINLAWLLAGWREHGKSILLSALTAGTISVLFYTDGFRHPQGAINAVKTFFVYETVAGHDKPFAWYAQLVALPVKSGGFWWFGTPVVLLALFAFFSSFRKDSSAPRTLRFIGYAALGHFLIYSLIAYKTPWLACLPWAHVCLLAGFALLGFSKQKTPVKGLLVLLVGFTLVTQFQQARLASGRLASDERNPFAYVPTRNEMENLEPWLLKLKQAAPGILLEPVAVVGKDYWPLPWYLRNFRKIGYWPAPPENLASLPLVFAMPEQMDGVSIQLEDSHTALPRGLRAGVPCFLFVRNDLWKIWMESGN